MAQPTNGNKDDENSTKKYPFGIEPGKTKIGAYTIIEDSDINPRYGKGGYSFVFPAKKDDDDDILYAIKIINVNGQIDQDIKNALEEEVTQSTKKMAALPPQSNLLQLIKQETWNGNPCIITEWVDCSAEEAIEKWALGGKK